MRIRERSSFRFILLVGFLALTGCTLDLTKWQAPSKAVDPIPSMVAVVGPNIASGTSASSFVFTVNYTDAATVTLANADIVLGGTDTAGCVAVVTGAGLATRTVTVNGCTGDGTVTISLAADSAVDSLGNSALAYGPSSAATLRNSFIVRFDTTKLSAGSSANNQVKLPLTYWAGYNFTVEWGDGQADTITSATWTPADPAVTHTYATPGLYDLKFKGALPAFQFSNAGDDKLKILDVKQWGPNVWDTAQEMFSGCANLQMSATDAPNLSGVTSLIAMFAGATVFNGAIGHWDTSNVTSMESMFAGAKAFNQPLGSWDMSNVVNIRYMFGEADAFNQNISTWDTSSVTDMSGMFYFAVAFNQPINSAGGHWDTSNVTAMNGMFSSASAFNQDIESWDTSSLTDVEGMFMDAAAFDQDLSSWTFANTVTHANFDLGAGSWTPGYKPTFLP
jgi:surface protein